MSRASRRRGNFDHGMTVERGWTAKVHINALLNAERVVSTWKSSRSRSKPSVVVVIQISPLSNTKLEPRVMGGATESSAVLYKVVGSGFVASGRDAFRSGQFEATRLPVLLLGKVTNRRCRTEENVSSHPGARASRAHDAPRQFPDPTGVTGRGNESSFTSGKPAQRDGSDAHDTSIRVLRHYGRDQK